MSRTDVESYLEHRNDDKRPTNDSKAVWDASKEIKPGDIVYAKAGWNALLGGVLSQEITILIIEFQNISIVIPLIGRVKVLGIYENKSHKNTD